MLGFIQGQHLTAALLALGTLSASGAAANANAGQARTARPAVHEIYGVVQSTRGSNLYLRLRDGRVIRVDTREADAADASVVLFPDRPVLVKGGTTADGVVHATLIARSRSNAAFWPADR